MAEAVVCGSYMFHSSYMEYVIFYLFVSVHARKFERSGSLQSIFKIYENVSRGNWLYEFLVSIQQNAHCVWAIKLKHVCGVDYSSSSMFNVLAMAIHQANNILFMTFYLCCKMYRIHLIDCVICSCRNYTALQRGGFFVLLYYSFLRSNNLFYFYKSISSTIVFINYSLNFPKDFLYI